MALTKAQAMSIAKDIETRTLGVGAQYGVNSREKAFIRGVSFWYKDPSEKQAKWLLDIHAKVLAKDGGTPATDHKEDNQPQAARSPEPFLPDFENNEYPETPRCGSCNGTGRLLAFDCPACAGSGDAS